MLVWITTGLVVPQTVHQPTAYPFEPPSVDQEAQIGCPPTPSRWLDTVRCPK